MKLINLSFRKKVWPSPQLRQLAPSVASIRQQCSRTERDRRERKQTKTPERRRSRCESRQKSQLHFLLCTYGSPSIIMLLFASLLAVCFLSLSSLSGSLLTVVMRQIRPKAHLFDVTLSMSVDPLLANRYVMGDPFRVQQVSDRLSLRLFVYWFVCVCAHD